MAYRKLVVSGYDAKLKIVAGECRGRFTILDSAWRVRISEIRGSPISEALY